MGVPMCFKHVSTVFLKECSIYGILQWILKESAERAVEGIPYCERRRGA